MAGHGVLVAIWETMRGAGESAWDVGRRRVLARMQDPDVQMIVIDRGDGVEAALLGYSMPLEPELADEFGDVARPLIELENEALGTWYLNAVATYPEARGRGNATMLLSLAEDLAADAGNTKVSLITSDDNADARRLYNRQGYRVTGSRAIVKGSWACDGNEWLLFVKEL